MTKFAKFILGIDEVGRGSLAGPVMLGGVLLDSNFPKLCFSKKQEGFKNDYQNFESLKIVRDSKKLKVLDREKVTEIAFDLEIPYLILSASNRLIDQYGIGVCLSHMVTLLIIFFEQMLKERLYKNLNHNLRNTLNKKEVLHKYLKIIIDGEIKILESLNPSLITQILQENNLENLNTKNFRIRDFTLDKNIFRENFADDKYLSVALASNLAKVFRDKNMTELSQQFPEFGWEKNKGYGTLSHVKAIKKNSTNSPNQFLRQTFLKKILKDI